MSDEPVSGDERRTSLSIERTQLAWWRTGLAALAVAVGIGRIVPELSNSKTTWPYAVVGIAFGLYGIALFLEGTAQGRMAGSRDRSERGSHPMRVWALALAGPVLGAVVIVMIAAAD